MCELMVRNIIPSVDALKQGQSEQQRKIKIKTKKHQQSKKYKKKSPKPGGYEKSFRDRTKGSGEIKYASHVDAFPVFSFFFPLPPSYLFILCARLCVHCWSKRGCDGGFGLRYLKKLKKG